LTTKGSSVFEEEEEEEDNLIKYKVVYDYILYIKFYYNFQTSVLSSTSGV